MRPTLFLFEGNGRAAEEPKTWKCRRGGESAAARGGTERGSHLCGSGSPARTREPLPRRWLEPGAARPRGQGPRHDQVLGAGQQAGADAAGALLRGAVRRVAAGALGTGLRSPVSWAKWRACVRAPWIMTKHGRLLVCQEADIVRKCLMRGEQQVVGQVLPPLILLACCSYFAWHSAMACWHTHLHTHVLTITSTPRSAPSLSIAATKSPTDATLLCSSSSVQVSCSQLSPAPFACAARRYRPHCPSSFLQAALTGLVFRRGADEDENELAVSQAPSNSAPRVAGQLRSASCSVRTSKRACQHTALTC